jgi:hypothetical protein
MVKAVIIAAVTVFFAGAVFGGIVAGANAPNTSPTEPAPTVTQTAMKTVTEYALTLECEEALRQAEVVLAASMKVSDTVGGLEQIIDDTKRASALDDVAELSRVQVQLRDYEQANADSFRELGITNATLATAITDCNNS